MALLTPLVCLVILGLAKRLPILGGNLTPLGSLGA